MATDASELIRGDEEEPAAEGEGREARPAKVDMGPDDALAILRRGEPIRDARIVGLRFKGEFPLPVRMERVVLDRPNFSKADFRDEVALNACRLVRARFGHGATFAKGLDLRGSTIVQGQLARLTVRGPLRCDYIRTVGPFVVLSSRFEAGARFWEARFGGWATFKDTVFLGEADFRSFHGEEGFELRDCRFEGDALFRGATAAKKWEAGASRFDGLLDLSKIKFHDFVYMERIVAGPGHRLAFHNALSERILIRAEQIEGRLASEQAGDHDRAMHEYGLLKRVFEGLHRYDQEDWAFYRFKVNQRRSRPRAWRRPWTKVAQAFDWLFLDLGCGYGTNPFRAVVASAVLMLAFAVLYMLDVSALPVEKAPFGGAVTSPLNRATIGVLTSVSTFTSGFGSLRDAATGWMNVPLIAESLLGTLLWGLFIVAFGRKVIR